MARPLRGDYLASDRPRHSYPLKGSKRRRSGGGWKNIGKPGTIKEYVGPYFDSKVKIGIPRHLWFKQEPIGPHAVRLYKEWLRRDAFWDAIEYLDTPVEVAGEVFFDVKRRQAEVIYRELREAGDAYGWLRKEALALFKAGKIPIGAAVEASPMADLFFTAMAGGEGRASEIDTLVFGGRMRVDLEETCENTSALERMYVQYIVCRRGR